MAASKWDHSDDPLGKRISSEELRKETIELLKECQDVNFLIEIFRNGSEDECNAACEQIVRLQETKYPHLAAALNDPDENVRKWVAVAIGRSCMRNGESLFIPKLASLLDDMSMAVREAAHNAIREILSAILSETNRAENEFDTGAGLREALLAMLGCRFEAARETAYGFMQDVLSEEKLVKTIAEGLPRAKGDAATRMRLFHERAMREFRLSGNGFTKEDKADLLKKGFIMVSGPSIQAQKRRKGLAN